MIALVVFSMVMGAIGGAVSLVLAIVSDGLIGKTCRIGLVILGLLLIAAAIIVIYRLGDT